LIEPIEKSALCQK